MGERSSRPVGHSLTKYMTRLDEAAAAVQYVTTAWDTYISLIAQDFPHEKTWLTACFRSICWRVVIERPSCALLSKSTIIFGSFHTCICFPTFFYWHGSTTNEDPKGDTSWDYKNTTVQDFFKRGTCRFTYWWLKSINVSAVSGSHVCKRRHDMHERDLNYKDTAWNMKKQVMREPITYYVAGLRVSFQAYVMQKR